MPVYNGAPFVERALRSLRAQSFTDWELLGVDDGSTDDSYERLCREGALDPRIRPFRLPENRGASAARNHALCRARGEIIAYLDCDDEYHPDYLAQVHTWRSAADVLVFAYDLLEERPGMPGLGQVRTWDPAPGRDRLTQECIVTPLGVAHRRDLLEAVGLFDESLSFEVDWDLWKRLARAGASFLFLPLKSGRYHVRPDSLARRHLLPGTVREAGGHCLQGS
jgi:glycosyltransferase involved in cell wall biosynthesis